MSRQRALLFDLAVAGVVALLVIVLSPGLALTGVIALVALIAVVLSLVLGGVSSRLFGRRRDPVEEIRRLRRRR